MDRVAALDDPQLRPFLPLLYVAWADGDLEDDERLTLLARLADQPWVRPAARQALAQWLAVDAPPSDDELQRLLGLLRAIAGTLGHDARNSLAALAEELATAE
jgi:acyl-CoA oxidase